MLYSYLGPHLVGFSFLLIFNTCITFFLNVRTFWKRLIKKNETNEIVNQNLNWMSFLFVSLIFYYHSFMVFHHVSICNHFLVGIGCYLRPIQMRNRFQSKNIIYFFVFWKVIVKFFIYLDINMSSHSCRSHQYSWH